MGLLDSILGNAVGIDSKEAEALVGPLLIEGEEVTHAYIVGVRDMLVRIALMMYPIIYI